MNNQNYRNASTNRYANLLKLIAGGKKKMVVLMTATASEQFLA